MKKQTWHVYIARGEMCASADFTEETAEQARTTAAALWKADRDDLSVHAGTDCWRHGCDGDSGDPLVRFAQIEKAQHATAAQCRESARIVRACAGALKKNGQPHIAADARAYARDLVRTAGRLDRQEAMRADGADRHYAAQYAHAAGYHE